MKNFVLSVLMCSFFPSLVSTSLYANNGPELASTDPVPVIQTPDATLFNEEPEGLHCKVELDSGITGECWFCNCKKLKEMLEQAEEANQDVNPTGPEQP